MQKIIAQLLSWIFIPLNIPVFVLAFAMFIPASIDYKSFQNSLFLLDPKAKVYFLSIFFIIGMIFPAVSILIMRWTKMIETVEMDNKKERSLPYILIVIYGLGLSFMIFNLNKTVFVSDHFLALALGCSIASMVNLGTNRLIKVSAHATGIGIGLGFLFSYYINQPIGNIWFLIAATLVGAAVIASRIILNKHTDLELLVGFVTGFAITFSLDFLLINNII